MRLKIHYVSWFAWRSWWRPWCFWNVFIHCKKINWISWVIQQIHYTEPLFKIIWIVQNRVEMCELRILIGIYYSSYFVNWFWFHNSMTYTLLLLLLLLSIHTRWCINDIIRSQRCYLRFRCRSKNEFIKK